MGTTSWNRAAARIALATTLLLPACSAVDEGGAGPSEEKSKAARALGPCGDVTYEGACRGTMLHWCEDGTLMEADCAASGRACGWQDDSVGYNCLGSSLPGSYDTCEDRFFAAYFDANNADVGGLAAMRDETLAALREAVGRLEGCGANVTLGGMMSLLLFEGALRVAAFNTRCNENSYNSTASSCDAAPEALYSYQFGIGALHTSNMHPCKGGSYTQGMRQRFLDFAGAAGFDTSPSLASASVAGRVHQFCPGAAVNAVDYYLLGAHDVFGIPRNTAGNDLAHYGEFPLFTPSMSIGLTFHMLESQCGSIWSDNDAIVIYGGGDGSYADPDKQWLILSAYQDFAAANCH